MSDPVLYEQHGRSVTLTLNRPASRNALSEDVVTALIAGLERADADTGVSCVILTGAGESFCAGGNLKEIRALTEEKQLGSAELAEWYRRGIQRIPLTFARLDVPVIAAVHGHAIGAGCDLAAMCDIRLASDEALFAESFLSVGIIPSDGGAWVLPRIIGYARAMQMLLTAEGVAAGKAAEWGLVSEVLPPERLLPRAKELAARIGAQPPQALRLAKRHFRSAQAKTLADALDEAAVLQGVLHHTEDHREAVSAILEKRKPSFTGH